MRPRAVKQAEGIYLASIGLMLVGSVLQWRALSAAYGVGVAAGTTAFSLGLWGLLLLFATRRGRNWARWALIVLTVIAVGSIAWQAALGLIAVGAIGALNVMQAVTAAIGAVLVTRPAAARWFARPHAGWEEDS